MIQRPCIVRMQEVALQTSGTSQHSHRLLGIVPWSCERQRPLNGLTHSPCLRGQVRLPSIACLQGPLGSGSCPLLCLECSTPTLTPINTSVFEETSRALAGGSLPIAFSIGDGTTPSVVTLCMSAPSAPCLHLPLWLPPSELRVLGGDWVFPVSVSAQCILDVQKYFKWEGNLEIVYHRPSVKTPRVQPWPLS